MCSRASTSGDGADDLQLDELIVVATELDGAGMPSHLAVVDTEGLSVLTAWAAGKFDAERIAKSVNTFGVLNKINHKKIIIPGFVASISGELEEQFAALEKKESALGEREERSRAKIRKEIEDAERKLAEREKAGTLDPDFGVEFLAGRAPSISGRKFVVCTG